MTHGETRRLTRRQALAIAVGAAGFAAIGGKKVLGRRRPNRR